MTTVSQDASRAYTDYQKHHAAFVEAQLLLASTDQAQVARGRKMMELAIAGQSDALNRFNLAVHESKLTGANLGMDATALKLADYQRDLATATAIGQAQNVNLVSGVEPIYSTPNAPATTPPNTNTTAAPAPKKKKWWQKVGDFLKKAAVVVTKVQQILTKVVAVVAPFIPGVGPLVSAAAAGMSEVYGMLNKEMKKAGW